MYRKSILLLLFFLIVAGLSGDLVSQDKVGTTAAPFLGISSGTRASAMGGAYVALSDDGSSMFYNPAGMAQVSYNSISFSNVRWFLDSQIQDASVIVNGGTKGNFALSVRALNYGEIDVTTITNPEGTGEQFTPIDLAVGFTYSNYITDKFSVGATTKFIQQKIWNEQALGFAVDLGMLYKTDFRNLTIGMSMLNFGTDMQLTGDDLRQPIDLSDENGNNERIEAFLGTDSWPLPLIFRVGLAIDAFETESHKMIFSIDAKHPNDNSESIDVGAEYGFKDLLFLRGGYRSLLSSEDEDQGYTLGFGLNYEINGIKTKLGGAYLSHKYLDDPLMWTLEVQF